MEEKLLILIVIYKTDLRKCPSFLSLSKTIESLSIPHEVLIYNNDPDTKFEGEVGLDNCTFVQAKENGFLTKPYNYALEYAEKSGHQWLMLLDQDSQLTPDFLQKLSITIPAAQRQTAAIVPIMKNGNVQVSPISYNPKWGHFWSFQTPQRPGIYTQCMSAINSCSTLRVDAIRSIEGFSEKYPLDFLDHWYYHQLYKKGFSIELLDSEIQHDLSIHDFHTLNETRYRNYMEASLRFAKELGICATIAFKSLTLLRAVKHLLIPHKRRFMKITISTLLK